MTWTTNIRPQLAFFQAVLFCFIIASGTVFMHKHKTADGRIVIHIHPYNLKTDSDATKHHQSASQIHLLDVVFQGSIIQTDFLTYEQPVITAVYIDYGTERDIKQPANRSTSAHPRGPPQYS